MAALHPRNRRTRFRHSPRAGPLLRDRSGSKIPKLRLPEPGQKGVLVGDVILMLINKHASGSPPLSSSKLACLINTRFAAWKFLILLF